MPEKLKMPSQDMHTEAWWIRVLDDELTRDEAVRWGAHLLECVSCRQELAALTRVDLFLSQASVPPALPADFTDRTVQMIARRQRWRRMLSFLAGSLVVAAASLLVAGVADSMFASFGQGVGVMFSARGMLFHSFVQTMLALLVRWRTMLPYMVGTALVAYALVMPNGLLMTFAIVWLSSRRRARGMA
ncbi:MAG: hypothetical protein MUQ30_08145 [Anaerolineae bacterium]|nr:hypothetical protein [Anaerolineae bacterium]